MSHKLPIVTYNELLTFPYSRRFQAMVHWNISSGR